MGNRPDFKAVFAVMSLLPAAVVLAAGPVRGAQGAVSPGVGNHLPALELTDHTGREHSLGWGPSAPKAAVVFFYEVRCTECVREMIFMDSLHRRAKDFGLEVFAVEGSGLDASGIEESLSRFRGMYGEPSFPVIPDPDYTLSTLFGVQRLPSSFLIERHGVILSRNKGFTDWEAVGLALKSERILGVAEHVLSSALRGIEVDESTEREIRLSYRSPAAEGRRGAPFPGGSLRVGDRVPGFTYSDMTGGHHQWAPGGEGPGLTVVFFWGALCRSCIQEMAFLEEVFLLARDRGLEIIAVEGSGLDGGRTSLVMERYRRFYPAPSYRIVPDHDYRIARLFGVTGKLPQTFFLDASGTVRYQTGEFIKGYEEVLTRKIEMALGLESGTLVNRPAAVLGPSIPSTDAEEAPSVVAGIEGREQFRSNLIQGDAYYEEWLFQKALLHYLRCVKIDPRHVPVRVRVAKIYQRQGRLEASLAHWLAVLELEPGHAEARTQVEFLRGLGVQADGSI